MGNIGESALLETLDERNHEKVKNSKIKVSAVINSIINVQVLKKYQMHVSYFSSMDQNISEPLA